MKWKRVDAGPPGKTLAPVVWFETISRWRARHDSPPSSLFFNKIATLTRFRLESKGFRVPLPFCWYFFGPTLSDTPYNVRYQSELESEHTWVDWAGPAPELYVGDRSADAIRETIDDLIATYPPDFPERAVDEAYRFAPFEFQRRFRRLRIASGVTGQSSRERPAETVGGFLGLVSDAFDEFPYDRFSELARFVGPVREAISSAWRSEGEQRVPLVVELLEGFWTAYCSYLRIVPEGHKDVSNRRIQSWRIQAESRRRLFARNFGDLVVEMAERNKELEDDPTLGPVIDQRLSDQTEEDKLIREGLEITSLLN